MLEQTVISSSSALSSGHQCDFWRLFLEERLGVWQTMGVRHAFQTNRAERRYHGHWGSQTDSSRDRLITYPPQGCSLSCYSHLKKTTDHVLPLHREKSGRDHLRRLLDASFSLTPHRLTKPCWFYCKNVLEPSWGPDHFPPRILLM